jgi:hypothetical protein
VGVTDRVRRELQDAANKAVEDLAEEVRRAAVVDAPPTDPTDDPNPAVSLRDSSYVERVPGAQDQARFEVGFRTAYAAKQHEAQHYKHPRGGVPKFLERNVTAAAARMEGRVAAEVTKVMRRGTERA